MHKDRAMMGKRDSLYIQKNIKKLDNNFVEKTSKK